MEISVDSWHYRLINKLFNEPSRSLCAYFWQLVLSLFLIALVVTLTASVLVFFSHVVMGVHYDEPENFISLLYVIGAIVATMAGGFVIVGSMTAAAVFTGKAIDKRPDISLKTSIAKEYIKAKKQKVCPRLTFRSVKQDK